MLRTLALLILLLSLNGVGLAQEDELDPDLIGAEGIGDPYFPDMGNGGYDVTHYDLDFDYKLSSNTLRATVTIDATTTQELGRFNLDFDGFEVSEILVNGDAVDFSREDTELVITPADTLAEGDPFTVQISYIGQPGWSYVEDSAFLAGQPSNAPSVFPVNGHPRDKATYAFEMTVDAGLEAIANGLLLETIEEDDGRVTYVWAAEDPMASYLVALAVGEYERVTQETTDGLLIRDYFAENVSGRTRAVFDRTAEMLDYFETLFGPYPFEVYGVVVHGVPLGFALETQTLSTFGSNITSERIVAHELAHQWFGDSVSIASWEHMWLNEGFASYAEVLWTEYTEGIEAAEASIRSRYELIAAPNPTLANFSPGSFANFLTQLEQDTGFPDLLFSREEARTIITQLMGDVLDEADITALVDALPGLGIQGEVLIETLRGVNFTRMTLRARETADFLRLIGEDERADDLLERVNLQRRAGDPSANFIFSVGVYQRGALTLHALRREIGDEAFFETLRTYAERFENDNATTEDFITVAEEISGRELDAFFDGWLYAPEVPELP